MATGNYILAADGQNLIWQRSNCFLERHLFVTGNVIRFYSFLAKDSREPLQIRLMTGLARQIGFVILFNRVLRFFDDRWKVCADAVRNAKCQFQCRVAKAPLDEAQHGFRNARTLRDRIIGKFPAFPLLSQEPDNFIANGFIVADTEHAEAWQESRFDIYFAMVKSRLREKVNFRVAEDISTVGKIFEGKTYLNRQFK